MSADDRCPPWIRLSTDDMTSIVGRYILGGKSTKEWADYGRYIGLMQLIARTPEGFIDVHDERRLKSLSVDLNMTPKACVAWLEVLVEGEAIEGEAYRAKGWVCIPDIYNHVQAYQSQVRVNKRNGAKGGRPRKTKQDATTETEPKPNG